MASPKWNVQNLEVRDEQKFEDQILHRYHRVHITLWVRSVDSNRSDGTLSGWNIHQGAMELTEVSKYTLVGPHIQPRAIR